MALINFPLSVSHMAAPALHTASQALANILKQHRFVELENINGPNSEYRKGHNYFFRKHGQCTINFLKDGRVHVLHGPIALWNLHDFLSNDELTILIAFATLSDEQQEIMRAYMSSRCRKYSDVMMQMPPFEVDWKSDFLRSISLVNF